MPNKHLVLLQVDEDCEPKIEEIDPGGPEVTEAMEEDQHHLSFHALKSVTGKGIMNFRGMIHGQPVQILVDGGSSDNFLQPCVGQFLKLAVQPSPNFR